MIHCYSCVVSSLLLDNVCLFRLSKLPHLPGRHAEQVRLPQSSSPRHDKYGPGAVAHTELMYSSLQFWCSSTCPWQLLDISNWDSWQTMMEVCKTHKIKYLKTFKVILLPGIACVLCDSNIKLVVEILLLIHLISAYPMFLNPPNQFFEAMMGIPPTFNWKRILFRTSVMVILLFLAESLPSFSAILQLISSIFVTCLTFVFPPLFYMRMVDTNSKKGNGK